MRNQFVLALTACFFLRLSSLPAQTPAATPNENPEGDTGALKSQITTGGSYDAHSGNATRIVTDLHLPGALGVHGLDFTRYWNSTPNDHDNGFAVAPAHFGASGWSHSWEWHAEEEDTSDKIDPMDDNSEEIWTTAITITFPDGHANRYKITRSNRWHVTAPPDPRCGPPYTVPEQNGFLIGGGVYDLLRDMAPDGSEFWLYQADGSAVHFIGGPGSYQASEVFDPHGLKTDLHYNPSGDLDQVTQEGGRWLTINWGYRYGWWREVITSVVSGGYAGVQSVQYDYGMFTHAQNGSQSLALTIVIYPEGVSATYNYEDYNGDPYRTFYFTGPRLLTANDPRFAGPMTKIRYSYRDSQCAPWEHPQSDPPDAHLDYFYAQGNSIAAEQSGDTGEGVSSFSLGCWTGTRWESSGLGGWRMYYFGHSAGYQGSGEHLGYQLIKLTDFTNQYPFPSNLPFERQNWQQGQAHQVWDGRGIETDLVVTGYNYSTGQSGDSSGEPSEIHHVTADGSVHRYDRVNPGASDARDPARIHSPFNHWVFSQTDERGLTTTYRRDSRRRVVDITYPDTNSEHYAYNDWNQIVTHTLPSGAVVTYDYDPTTHRLVREYNSVDGWDARKEYTYDSLERVATVADGRSRSAGKDFSTRMTYNGRNQVLTVEYAGMLNATNPTLSYGYDPYGNCNSITDEMGHTSTYTYDSYRRCTSYVEPLNAPDGNGGPNVASRRWDWLYDRWIDVLGPRGAYTHTKNEWRIQIEPAFNYLYERRMTARAHDLQNRIVIEQTGWIQRPTWIGDWYPSGDLETHYFSYDENGNKSSYTDPMGRVTSYSYDLRNRLWKTIEPLNRITENQYDVTGNKILTVFPDTRTQQWLDYTPFGQAERFIDERGNTTNLNHQWGPMKKLASVVTHRDRDGGGTEDQPTTFQYDPMGRPTWTFFPDGSTELTTYVFGQVDAFKTRKNQTKRVHYDARGREDYHTWDGDAAPRIDRTWDLASRLTSISNSWATINYGYDDAAQVWWENEYVAGADTSVQTNYVRYGDGAIWRIQYPNGLLVAHSYTARGQLQTVWENSPGWWRTAVTYNYYADGKVEHQDYGNGTTSTFGCDGRGFTSSVSHTRGGANLASRTYYRDTRDRIVAWQKSTNTGANPMEDGRGDHYYYDFEGELTDAYYGAVDPLNNPNSWVREDHFNYDALGNRRSWDYIASRGQWMNFTRKDNGLNQYRAWWNYSWINYDDDIGNGWGSPGAANGVLMQDGWITAGFNALNQPMYIWSANVGWTYFGYDPLGRCVKRWNDAGSTAYLYYDGWNLIQEGSQSWNAERQYVHGARVDEVVAQITPPNNWIRYFHYDASGHCTLQTDGWGNIVEQYYYDAFGYPYFYDAWGNYLGYSPWGNRFLFTGREWLSDLKLYDYRNRMYQPELGRFLQPDPKEFGAGDYNLYRYCHNDPVNKSDPFGLELDAVYSISNQTLVVVNRDNGERIVVSASSGTNKLSDIGSRDRGPVPPGSYSIYSRGADSNGASRYILDPNDNRPHNDTLDGKSQKEGGGRYAFRIHAENPNAPQKGSEGCVVTGRDSLAKIDKMASETSKGPSATIVSEGKKPGEQTDIFRDKERLGILKVGR